MVKNRHFQQMKWKTSNLTEFFMRVWLFCVKITEILRKKNHKKITASWFRLKSLYWICETLCIYFHVPAQQNKNK